MLRTIAEENTLNTFEQKFVFMKGSKKMIAGTPKDLEEGKIWTSMKEFEQRSLLILRGKRGYSVDNVYLSNEGFFSKLEW